MKKFFHFLVLGFLALLFTACSPTRVVYTPEQSAKFAFNVSESSALQNPAADKARIYALRASSFKGVLINYSLYYQYNPNINAQNQWVNEQSVYMNEIKQNNFGLMSSGTGYVKDFEPGKPLLLIGSTETYSYIVFTPEAGKIYCVEGSLKFGWWAGRPNVNLINQARCESLYKSLLQKSRITDFTK